MLLSLNTLPIQEHNHVRENPRSARARTYVHCPNPFQFHLGAIMKYKIINIYAGFQNCYGDLAWRVYSGSKYIYSFRTRANAREYVKTLKSCVTK
jgi:hypothetical protein